jgi:hypothetical protein
MSWDTKRRKPYTTAGIARCKCIRCGAQSKYQWQICADGNNYRTFCERCDVVLNRLVLKFMLHPDAKAVGDAYEASR